MRRPDAARLERYGLTLQQWEQMLENQGGACAICKRFPTELFIDHCHSTGKVRGLLCRRCNTALGMFLDEKYRLKNAIEYLDGLCPTNPRPLPIGVSKPARGPEGMGETPTDGVGGARPTTG